MRPPLATTIVLAMAALAGCRQADAPMLTGALTADNAFYAYLSTSPSERGTLIASGDSWGTTVSLIPTALTRGQAYFLHVEAINYGDRGGFIGEFHLTGSGFVFADGTRRLLTGLSSWSAGFNNPNAAIVAQGWISPGGGVFPEGANGAAPWGPVKDVAPAAQWIWPADALSAPSGPPNACTGCTVDFSAVITPG